jgi:hypothetical protein
MIMSTFGSSMTAARLPRWRSRAEPLAPEIRSAQTARIELALPGEWVPRLAPASPTGVHSRGGCDSRTDRGPLSWPTAGTRVRSAKWYTRPVAGLE